MNNPSDEPTRDDVLDSFAVETSQTRETLEKYLRAYPQFSTALVDLSRELRHTFVDDDRSLSDLERELLEAAWQTHMPLETKSMKDPLAGLSVERLREIALQLDVPRQVLTAFRERRVIANSVPGRFMRKLANALNCTADRLVDALAIQAGQDLVRSYKADEKPALPPAVSFAKLLIDAGVAEGKLALLLADGD